MSEEFKIEIVNPEKSFLVKEDVTEVVVPAFEGEMGILKDHISIISFLKPGIIIIHSKSGEEKFFVEDGTAEFFQDTLIILSASAINQFISVFDIVSRGLCSISRALAESFSESLSSNSIVINVRLPSAMSPPRSFP